MKTSKRSRIARARSPEERSENVSKSPMQRKLDVSPIMVAQRERLDHIFGGTAQREVELDEEDQEATSQLKAGVVQKQENDTGLPDNLKSGVESLSGHDMSDVKVHYNSPQPAQLNALAYAQGTNIHVGPGQERHLPHETWHVAQQKQGRVAPTTEVGGVPVNDSPSLESEADVMGGRASRMNTGMDQA